MADEWNNGLCDHVCGGDCGTCLSAWFCSCFLYGRTDQRLRQFPATDKSLFSACSSGCWIFCAAGVCSMHWLVALMKRGEMRDRFGIKGNGCTDCLLSCCCTPCMLAQMETEVKDRAVRAGNGGAHDVKHGEYASPAPLGGMHYGQQHPQEQKHDPFQQQQQQQPQHPLQHQPQHEHPYQPYQAVPAPQQY